MPLCQSARRVRHAEWCSLVLFMASRCKLVLHRYCSGGLHRLSCKVHSFFVPMFALVLHQELFPWGW